MYIASACLQARMLAKAHWPQRWTRWLQVKMFESLYLPECLYLLEVDAADGIVVPVSMAGWNGVGVEVEFGATVTRLKSGI